MTKGQGSSSQPVGIITGALGGIGAAAAIQFAQVHARIVLVDLSLVGGEELCEKIRSAGGEALLVSADARDVEAQKNVAQRALDEWGRIDFLLANAAVGDQSTIATGDPERWRALVETNLLGVIYSCHAVAPAMLEQGSGHILIMSSVSGRDSYVGEPVYIATKWGLVGFAHSLQLELYEAGIRVTIVEPGLVDTPLTRRQPETRLLMDKFEPLHAEDVARAVVYAYQQPQHVVLSEVTIRPQRQPAAHL